MNLCVFVKVDNPQIREIALTEMNKYHFFYKLKMTISVQFCPTIYAKIMEGVQIVLWIPFGYSLSL